MHHFPFPVLPPFSLPASTGAWVAFTGVSFRVAPVSRHPNLQMIKENTIDLFFIQSLYLRHMLMQHKDKSIGTHLLFMSVKSLLVYWSGTRCAQHSLCILITLTNYIYYPKQCQLGKYCQIPILDNSDPVQFCSVPD